MRLVKYCRPQDNITRGAQLRLGTLNEYRDIENDELRDESEGRYDFLVDFQGPAVVDNRTLQAMFGNALRLPGVVGRYSGEMQAYVHTMEVETTPHGVSIVRNASVEMSHLVSNCLILCTSRVDDGEDILPGPFAQYSDHWSIEGESADEFARRLQTLIVEQIDAAMLELGGSEIATLRASVSHGPVGYADRQPVLRADNFPTYEELASILNKLHFTKPIRFAREKEYRFVFELHDDKLRRIYPREALLVSVPELLSNL